MKTSTLRDARRSRSTPSAGRRFGYVVAIAVNLLMMLIVNNLTDWGVLPFLTDDFDQVLGLVNLSLAATILGNVFYVSYDPRWLKSLSQVVINVIAFLATIGIYQVFPFDFSAYEFGWAGVTRVILILAMVGTAVGVVIEMVKLARVVLTEQPD